MKRTLMFVDIYFQGGFCMKQIKISDDESILLEEKSEDGYRWVEVIFELEDERIFIGSYYTLDYYAGHEWMKYNTDTIAIAKRSYSDNSIQVETLFDKKTRLFITGSNEDLLEYYNQQFENEKQDKENVNFQRVLLIKRG